MFEGVYSVPKGVSYNSYLLKGDKNVLFDTVDKSVRLRFLENLEAALGGGGLDYLVVQHMEPDHSALVGELAALYPSLTVICTRMAHEIMGRFLGGKTPGRVRIVGDGDTLDTGGHTLTFITAPMVHWPEVMVTYDSASGTLFSADAFGCFGALNGALFADEVDFMRDYLDEARRYYANIVGKYGTQVRALLEKASGVDIKMICPLHGFAWRSGIGGILSKYAQWSGYEPEEDGVVIAYASIYGNTENAAETLSGRLRELGVRTVMYDVSVTPPSEVLAAAFKWSHLVLASSTYNAGVFTAMNALVCELASHRVSNRKVAVIENGSWAPTSGGLIKEGLAACEGIDYIGETVTVESSVKGDSRDRIIALADAITGTVPGAKDPAPSAAAAATATSPSAGAGPAPAAGKAAIDQTALFRIPYGLYVLTTALGGKDNGCIINTAGLVTDTPHKVSVTVSKRNLTHDMVMDSGMFNVSILTEKTPFSVFERFGFKSGRDADKLAGLGDSAGRLNGMPYLREHTGAVISGRVLSATDLETHTTFVALVTEAAILSGDRSLTYGYYQEHIKPKPKPPKEAKAGFTCNVCGFFLEGAEIPADFICPLCKHGADAFAPSPPS